MPRTKVIEFPPLRPFSIEAEPKYAQEEGRKETNIVTTDIMGQVLEEHLGFRADEHLQSQESFNSFIKHAQTKILGEVKYDTDRFDETVTLNEALEFLEPQHAAAIELVIQELGMQSETLNGKYQFIGDQYLEHEHEAYYLTKPPGDAFFVHITRDRIVKPGTLWEVLGGSQAHFILFIYFGIHSLLAEQLGTGSQAWKDATDQLVQLVEPHGYIRGKKYPQIRELKIIMNFNSLFYRLAHIPVEWENLVRVTKNQLDLYELMVNASELAQDFLQVASPALIKLLAQRTYFAEGQIEVYREEYRKDKRKPFKTVVNIFNDLLGSSWEKHEVENEELINLILKHKNLARAILVVLLDRKTRANFLYAIRVELTGHGDPNEPVEAHLQGLEYRNQIHQKQANFRKHT